MDHGVDLLVSSASQSLPLPDSRIILTEVSDLGFETVTYMLQGASTHQDFAGHKGTIRAGDLQWMTAGRGIIHSEMPAGEGENKGLQLWINLSSKDKM
ncbi:pirin-like protein [Musa troglodytarum]|uniref:Pirin-like protein n=1 Tax=Musa troglodytarum TaxID=320322 RepID=A0A9E7LE99_9LILI|nr:pirin-like protein [Musa troglodytarum]